jgi:hypothetical protein
MEEPEAAADHPTKTRAESMSQEHVTIAKNELELLKQRLQETEDKLKQAEGARQYCVGEAAKHHAEYYADLDKQTSKSRVAFDQIAEMAVENDQLKRSLEERKALGEKLDSSNRSLKLQLEADVSAESSGGPRTRSKRKNEEALRYDVMRIESKILFADHGNFRADEAKRNKKGITVTCTRCLALGLQCDNSNTCKRCSSAWKTCKRVKCKRFEVGRCFNGACTFAHEGDQFENLVPFTRIKQVAPENTSRSATKTSDNSSVVKKEYDRDVYGYMALFDEIARRRKGRDGQDDGVAGPPGK